jgi:hypothetical protein
MPQKPATIKPTRETRPAVWCRLYDRHIQIPWSGGRHRSVTLSYFAPRPITVTRRDPPTVRIEARS